MLRLLRRSAQDDIRHMVTERRARYFVAEMYGYANYSHIRLAVFSIWKDMTWSFFGADGFFISKSHYTICIPVFFCRILISLL